MIPDSYEDFKTKVFQLTKIDLSSYKERQMKRRIDSLITRHSIATYTDYVEKLRTNKEMFDEFVTFLTINVSEFYRNPDQWTLLEKEILPQILAKNKKPRIWSAACSTGDEPYSLAMLLAKYIPLRDIHIIATDIDKQILEKAKAGLYNVKSLKALPTEFIDKYFIKINDTSYKIKDEIKNCVEFKQHNLLKDEYPSQCDLIVCRNVVIYFTEEAKEAIYRKFSNALIQGGVLFVGSTEQIIQPASVGFESIRAFFYRKH